MAIQKNHALVAVIVGVLFLGIGTLVQLGRATTDERSTVETTAQQPATATVQITDAGIVPATLSVKPGTIVEWTNTSTKAHTVTFSEESAAGKLPDLEPMQSTTMAFNQSGDIGYTVDGIEDFATISVKD